MKKLLLVLGAMFALTTFADDPVAFGTITTNTLMYTAAQVNSGLADATSNLSTSGQVATVSLQVAGADAILRAFISGEILAEAEAFTAEMREEHTTNDVVHITAQERAAWDAKQDALPYQTNAIPAAVIAGAPWLLSFTEQDPNVYDWAKAATKPQYGWSEITNKPNFAAVATSGDYADLANKPNLATVATSGQYSDLSGTPTIPTVPTAVSAFTNDAGYLTSYTESDPQAAGIASNVVTTAYIQEKLGVYLYIGQDGHCYVHTPEE